MAVHDALYNPRDRATINDPLTIFRHLQDEDPCHWCAPLKSWVFTRYADVREVLLDEQISADRLTPYFASLPSEQRRGVAEVIKYLNTWVAFKDPPDHMRIRSLLNKVFTPGAIRNLRPSITDAVAQLIDPLRNIEAFDFVKEFAYPLPATVILTMLGLPPEDMERLHEWSAEMQPFIGGATTSTDKYARAEAGAIAMADYFRAAIRERASRPRDDMLTKLVACRENDDALSEDEVIGSAILFLFGGHETTTNLIGNGVRALLQHPEQGSQLRAKPELTKAAVEEILRFDGPTLASVRLVGTEHERHGRTLKRGDRVFVMIHGANHDQRIFDDPGIFEITRNPNPHLTFNYGIHFCLGAPLARLEGEIAIGEVFQQLPNLGLAANQYDYMDTMVMRGVWTMPVRQT
ncbi:MAG: cytochrome P450 [Gammaproteobacteria bacterium]|jgi:cytochrome P450